MCKATVRRFKQGRYKLKWAESGKTERLLPQDLLRRKIKVLEAPDSPKSQHFWSQRGKSAVVARRKTGEKYESIALSFGRTMKSVETTGVKLMDLKYAPTSGTQGKKTGHKVGWRLVATKALQQLPNCAGTAKQVAAIQCSQHCKLMGVAGAGGCAMDAGSVWQIRL